MQYYILFNSLLVIASCFLSWIEPKLFVIAMRGIQMVDGQIVFVLGFISFVTICYELLRRKEQLYWVYGLTGFIISIIAGMEFYSFYQNQYSGGAGIFLATLGGIQLTGSYIVVLLQKGKPGASAP